MFSCLQAHQATTKAHCSTTSGSITVGTHSLTRKHLTVSPPPRKIFYTILTTLLSKPSPTCPATLAPVPSIAMLASTPQQTSPTSQADLTSPKGKTRQGDGKSASDCVPRSSCVQAIRDSEASAWPRRRAREGGWTLHTAQANRALRRKGCDRSEVIMR